MTDRVDNVEASPEPDEAVRQRLSPTALKVVLRIGEKWKITQEGTLALIRLHKLPSARDVTLNAEQFYRAGLLIEIFKAANEIFDRPLADSWPSQPNRHSLFGSASPIEMMMNGGVSVMVDVLQYLRATQQGL